MEEQASRCSCTIVVAQPSHLVVAERTESARERERASERASEKERETESDGEGESTGERERPFKLRATVCFGTS